MKAASATAAVVITVGMTLLTAGCGSSTGSHTARSGLSVSQNRAVSFARCMRSHRVPNWPDPDSAGAFDKSKLTTQQLGAPPSQVQAAQTACQHLVPNGGRAPSAARLQQVKAQGFEFARCVRSHGLRNFPDPDSTGRIPDPATVGIDQGSPRFQAANQACGKYRPPYMPSNSAYDAYARTHGG
jgi:hypothetical protein